MTAPTAPADWSEERLRRTYAGSADVHIEPCRYGGGQEPDALLVYAIGLCDTTAIHQIVLPALGRHYGTPEPSLPTLDALSTRLGLLPMEEEPTTETLDDTIFEGDLVLYFTQERRWFSMSINRRPQRTPDESNTEISIKGPRDGFTEDLETNVALIRKRIRSRSLCVETHTLGRRTRTKAALLYFDDIINPRILADVRKKLAKFDVDGIYSINQLEESLTGSKLKLLPLLHYTGRPDFCVNGLLAGRFVLVLDGIPLVIVAPAGLTLILKSPEDAHFNYSYVSFARLIRLLSLFLSVFLPAIWVALVAFHQDQIPFRILATISVSRLGLPFSSQIELLILMMMLEIFREAGVRLPSAIGQTLTSIGGLIIGDAAIRSGLISPSVVVVGAVTAVSSTTLVNQSLSVVVSILRFFFFGLACYLGMYGVILGIVVFIAYMSSQSSFGVSYLAPLSPLGIKDLIPSFLRVPWFMMKRRPKVLQTQDEDKQGS